MANVYISPGDLTAEQVTALQAALDAATLELVGPAHRIIVGEAPPPGAPPAEEAPAPEAASEDPA